MKDILANIESSLSDIYTHDELKYISRALCTELLNISQTDYYLKNKILLSQEEHSQLDRSLKRLIDKEPLQYVLGKSFFCGLPIHVDKRVLIPRPETGELVGWICSVVNKNDVRLLDIGTGSGCIAIYINHCCPNWYVEGWDNSEDALNVARQNNLDNETTVSFKNVDILSDSIDVQTKYDIIVSNPPYIVETEKTEMEDTVLNFEPHEALFVPNEDPLRFYRSIAVFGLDHLNNKGYLFFEINPFYSSELISMLEGYGYEEITLKKDIFGKDRMIKANIHE